MSTAATPARVFVNTRRVPRYPLAVPADVTVLRSGIPFSIPGRSVTLGAGKPLLPRAITNPPLRLLSVRAVGTGFAELHYAVPSPSSGA